jgi:hypothetical protein
MTSEPKTGASVGGGDPRPAAVAFVTTEHFTLQGARAATIAESTSRATMFLGSVSAGLVALGLLATATRIGTTFFAFSVVVLSTLAFVGLVTFERVLQSGIEDLGYAERIARLRAYYFDWAPEMISYLASVPPPQRLAMIGIYTSTGTRKIQNMSWRAGYWQGFRTVAGMVAVVTAVLTGSAAGLIAAIAAGHSALAGFVTGGAVALGILVVLMRFQSSAWKQNHQRLFFDGQEETAPQVGPEEASQGQ